MVRTKAVSSPRQQAKRLAARPREDRVVWRFVDEALRKNNIAARLVPKTRGANDCLAQSQKIELL
jgi:hypothetical protein